MTTTQRQKTISIIAQTHFNATDTDGSVTDMSTQYRNWVSSTTLSYNKTFADKHVLSALVGFEAEERRIPSSYAQAERSFLQVPWRL